MKLNSAQRAYAIRYCDFYSSIPMDPDEWVFAMHGMLGPGRAHFESMSDDALYKEFCDYYRIFGDDAFYSLKGGED